MKIVEFLEFLTFEVLLPIFVILCFVILIIWLLVVIYMIWQLVGVVDDCGARQVLLDLWHGTEECGG